MGELTDMEMLEMTQELLVVSSPSIDISARRKAYLATVRRIEAHTSIEESPFHVVIIGRWNIESECSSA
jgi:hypothetical protein